MEVIKTIKPGQHGTKRYSRRYGERLCAVRYRTSDCGRKIYTTVEIVVDERVRPEPGTSERSFQARRKAEAVALRIGYEEMELRRLVREAGAKWSKQTRAWITRRHIAVSLGLSDRILEGLAEKCTDIDTSIAI